MPDIELRFHKDMLVLSAPVGYALERQGVDVESDGELVGLMEPETVRDAMKLEALAGAQCLVTDTEGICEARLARKRMEDRAADVAQAALAAVEQCAPQHIVCAIGSCGLPIDPTSEPSRAQAVAQYADAVRAFGDAAFDAVLLDGLRSLEDIRCAIEGVRSACDRPVFASAALDAQGLVAGVGLEDAVAALSRADVVGVSLSAAPDAACSAVRRIAALTDRPIMVQLELQAATPLQKKRAMLGDSIPGNPYALPDSLADAAVALRAAGAQFLRARGQATPACTGALAAAVSGADCLR